MAEKYNELSGKDWLRYSFSIWRDLRKNTEERQLKHPAMFPIQLAERIIGIYTKKDGMVIDPFMGIGSSLIAAKEKGRSAIGFELSKEYAEAAKKRIELTAESGNGDVKVYKKDARLIGKYVKPKSVDLCLTSPPYWDILNMRRSADKKKIRNYSNSNIDLGNIADYECFLDELKVIFSGVYKVLKFKGHCVVVLMDIRKKNKFYPFHSDLTSRMEKIGFSLEDILIWDRQHEYNNMKPLGYPYVFRVNKVHEYILIFRKLGERDGQ